MTTEGVKVGLNDKNRTNRKHTRNCTVKDINTKKVMIFEDKNHSYSGLASAPTYRSQMKMPAQRTQDIKQEDIIQNLFLFLFCFCFFGGDRSSFFHS